MLSVCLDGEVAEWSKAHAWNACRRCPRLVGSNPTLTATYTLRTHDGVPSGAFFLFGSKGFNEAIRLSETNDLTEIGLRTPRVSFHPPFTQVETDLKLVVFSDAWRKRTEPQLRRF